MTQDLLDLYGQASGWTASIVEGAADRLDTPTPCEGWDVRTLLSHVIQTQQFFVGRARGEEPPISPDPPDLVGDDPVGAFARARSDTLQTFGEDGVIERTGPSLGIAFSDMLLHGWDLATATGQDATMPDGLAQAAYDMIYGRFTEEQRAGVFAPEVPVGADASPQDRLLAYTGRDPKKGRG
jgi:uncharacterized protein (TIGR03086 family)